MTPGSKQAIAKEHTEMASITSSAPLTSPASATARTIGWGRYALVGLGTIVAAVLANVLVYTLGSVVVEYRPDFVVLASIGGTLIFTIVPAIVAVLLYAMLLRFARRPERTFSIIAAIVLAVSIIPDFTYIPDVPGATPSQIAILVLMHIVAAVVIVGLLTTRTRPQGR